MDFRDSDISDDEFESNPASIIDDLDTMVGDGDGSDSDSDSDHDDVVGGNESGSDSECGTGGTNYLQIGPIYTGPDHPATPVSRVAMRYMAGDAYNPGNFYISWEMMGWGMWYQFGMMCETIWVYGWAVRSKLYKQILLVTVVLALAYVVISWSRSRHDNSWKTGAGDMGPFNIITSYPSHQKFDEYIWARVEKKWNDIIDGNAMDDDDLGPASLVTLPGDHPRQTSDPVAKDDDPAGSLPPQDQPRHPSHPHRSRITTVE